MKIGILTCRNSTQELNCCSTGCLVEAQAGTGEFAAHKDKGGSQVIGIISCAGCPTLTAPQKVLERVRSLVTMGAEAVHFSSCMLYICPFVNKYKSVLEEAFPKVSFIQGTHSSGPDPKALKKMFQGAVKDMLSKPKPSIPDMMAKLGRTPA